MEAEAKTLKTITEGEITHAHLSGTEAEDVREQVEDRLGEVCGSDVDWDAPVDNEFGEEVRTLVIERIGALDD